MKININNSRWVMVKEFAGQNLWSTKHWLCDDNDTPELYIFSDKSGFELYCFSGVPSSNIFIDYVDFNTLWNKILKTQDKLNPINEYSFNKQCVIIADYLCSLFCQLNN